MNKKVTSSDSKVNRMFSENALKMLKKRYLVTYENGKQETPADMFRRVAKSISATEKNYGYDAKFVKKVEKDFFNIMASHEFTPAGRTMTNAGAGTSLIANCIVLPVEDSMSGIFQTLKEAALLQQAGSGLGFAFDSLRPSMSVTKRSRGTSSGPISFLKVYNEAFRTIKQQGRHGANMAMMSVSHPDILNFIRAKEIEGEINCFNISVKVTDEFMKQLINNPDSQWYCEWKGEKMKPFEVLKYPNGSAYGTKEVDITVSELFGELVNYAWINGEPGIVFIDTVNADNPLPQLGRIECSNPCGEQFLHAYDNCNLGSINLAKFVKNKKIDYKRLGAVTAVATRFLDNVIDQFDFPVPQVTELAKKNRRIGLGIMGFADMLFQIGVAYDSEDGRIIAEKVMGTIQKASHEASQLLAKEKAVFPNWKGSVWEKKKVKMRNASLTTVAPTGSISMMFNASSGMEPQFALAFIKQDKDGTQYNYLNEYFDAALKNREFSEDKINYIKEEVIRTGTIQHLTDLPEDLRRTFVTAMDISGENHIRMQSAFQKQVDNSISKTINLPNSATKEDVKQSFILAWQLGCKSCTVYRDGSRNVQILNLGDSAGITSTTESPTALKKVGVQEELNLAVDKNRIEPRVRPELLSGRTYRIKTGYGNIYVTINNDQNGVPFEVFATIGKSGGFFQEHSEAICRLISLSLRSGVKVEEVIDQIKGIRGPMPVMTERGTILSLSDAIGQILEGHVTGAVMEVKDEIPIASVGAHISESQKDMADFGFMPGCPDCGASLSMTEGCISCKSCGFSRCL